MSRMVRLMDKMDKEGKKDEGIGLLFFSGIAKDLPLLFECLTNFYGGDEKLINVIYDAYFFNKNKSRRGSFHSSFSPSAKN